ncbi:MAG TPA: methyltransferase domain-containing protein [Candidatus Paceibacterota bacterium]|nr:methyltransferase domain-containing protein [Candidatus Paceibacterota bacterium]
MIESPEKQNRVVVWNPGDYAANSASQQSWARELIAKLRLHGNEHVLDVGCGDGKITAELARTLPNGAAMGIDASPQMIDFAQKAFPQSQFPNLHFQVMDARAIHPDASSSALDVQRSMFDVVFSNAALHWVNDHQAFLRGASACLRRGGRLVVSCGGKGNAQDVFLVLRSQMRLKRWKEFFRDLERPYFFHNPEDYQKWLPRSGFESRSVRLAEKDMAFEDPGKFAGWFRTTWLPYTQRVPESLREEFIAAVVDRYIAKHPLDAAGQVHVRMVRLEIDAVKV